MKLIVTCWNHSLTHSLFYFVLDIFPQILLRHRRRWGAARGWAGFAQGQQTQWVPRSRGGDRLYFWLNWEFFWDSAGTEAERQAVPVGIPLSVWPRQWWEPLWRGWGPGAFLPRQRQGEATGAVPPICEVRQRAALAKPRCDSRPHLFPD